MLALAHIAIGATLVVNGPPRGQSLDVTVSAQLATYTSLTIEGNTVVAEFQGVPSADAPNGFTRDVWSLGDVMLASGEGRLSVDESGLLVIPWPLLPLPALPTEIAVTPDWRNPGPYNIPDVPEQNTLNEIAAR